MIRPAVLIFASIVLASSQSGGCGGSGGNKTVAGASPAVVTCTETPVGNSSGITISVGIITGTMQVACTGGEPDTYDFRMILVRDGTMLQASGNTEEIVVPDSTGYTVTRIATCAPGRWHVYYLVTWTLNGAAVHNTTTTTSDRQVVLDDC